MVLFLFSGMLSAQNPEAKKAGGPIIDSLELNEAYTQWEALEIIRKAASKGDDSFALAVTLSESELKSKLTGSLSLRKVPTIVALSYLCEIVGLKLTYEEGIWKVENASSGVGPDEIQVRIEGITDEEYQALGLEEKPGIGFVTADGKKWPTGQYESSHKFKNLLILRARRVKIDSFKALLQLHRAGYKIPKIDSNQPEGK